MHLSLAEVDALAAATPVGECFPPSPPNFILFCVCLSANC